MKRFLLLKLLLILVPNLLWAATYTASVTGNWSNSATWGGSNPATFTTGDTATINTGITITIDVNVGAGGDSYTIGATTVRGRMTMGTNITFTLNGTLQIGAGSPTNDGQFDFAPGSIVALNGQNFLWRNGTYTSTATSGNWAKVTGTGAITNGGVLAKQNINLSYVSFQQTGALSWEVGNTTGSATSSMTVDHCAFDTTGALTFGSTNTPLATTMSITNSDFYTTGTILLKGTSGTGSGTKTFSHNTLRSASSIDFSIQGTDGYTVQNNVFINYKYGGSSTTGGHTYNVNYFYNDILASGSNLIATTDAAVAITLSNNYFYVNWTNAKITSAALGTAGGTQTITGNVVDYKTASGEAFLLGTSARTITNNLLFDQSQLIYTSLDATTPGIVNVKNNTVYGNTAAITLLEVSINDFTGTINFANNIASKNGSSTGSYGLFSNGVNQTIAYSDYNVLNNLATNYDTEFTVTSGQTHDKDDVNPNFLDTSRNIAAWNGKFGNGTSTVAEANNYLQTINGYNTTTKTQSDTPSAYLPSDAVKWVRYGFSPTNGVLYKAGDPSDGSPTIGAMEWQNPRRKRAM